MYNKSQYNKLNRAYNLGRRAARKGKTFGDNPFLSPPLCTSRSFYEHGAWVRGFLSETVKR